jgi:RND family efflux transporter MFP subunit
VVPSSAARILAAVLSTAAVAAGGAELEGFTEPYRVADISSPEAGRIAAIHVEEGDRVAAGQELATLDTRILRSNLAIAEARAEAEGRIRSARSVRDRQALRCERLLSLRKKGHAHAEEIAHAQADLEVAEASLKTVEEDLAIAALERDRVLEQIERRRLRSPFEATVIGVHMQAGESLRAQGEPVVTLADIDRLQINLHVSKDQVAALSEGAVVSVSCSDGEYSGEAVVELILPVIDPESGTTRVKLRIDNLSGGIRAGQRCSSETGSGVASARNDGTYPHSAEVRSQDPRDF